MDDKQIIELYWARDEEAIRQTEASYGRRLHGLSDRIVCNREDAQECVSDTYLKAWNTIPPQWPNYFFAYLAKICRRLSLDRLDWNNAIKRRADIVSLTAEMEQCIPDCSRDGEPEGAQIGELLNRFLASLPQESRRVFLRRYWFTDSVAEIAQRYGIGESKVKTQLHRTRKKLRTFLEKEGIGL